MDTNRRNFLVAGGLGLASLGLPSLVESKETQKKKSVIFIHFGGGASQSETFVANPDSTDSYKSSTGYVKTKSGFYLGGYWDELAKNSHLYSPVHSFSHTNNGHNSGTVWVNSGYNFNNEEPQSAQQNPSYGSIISKYFGSNNLDSGLPNYITTSRVSGQDSAYLGSLYKPFSIDEQGKKNLSLLIEVDRLAERRNLLSNMDKQADEKFAKYRDQGYNIISGNVKEAFDISKESESTKEKYGKNRFGENLLLARRLIENGSKFVTASVGGFDLHSDIAKGMQNLVPNIDKAISQLLIDLHDRGLLKTTLVVITTEFGRTKINQNQGKDHWSYSIPLLLAGGQYGGAVIGQADKNSSVTKDNPFKPVDLLHTILTHVEIPTTQQFIDFSGRPRNIISEPSKLIV